MNNKSSIIEDVIQLYNLPDDLPVGIPEYEINAAEITGIAIKYSQCYVILTIVNYYYSKNCFLEFECFMTKRNLYSILN